MRYRGTTCQSGDRILIVILQIVQVLLTIIWWIIIVQAILSWLLAFNVINTYNDTVRTIWEALRRMTEPLYRPIRRILPDFGALDLSPLVVLIGIVVLQKLVSAGINQLMYGVAAASV
jgi:YggT family protein